MTRAARRQRGQALLLVLVFVAAFLVLTWAVLKLASAGFLGLSSAQVDTKTTYALDSGLDHGISYVDANATTTTFTWLTVASYADQTLPAGNYTFTLDVNASKCKAAPNDCLVTVSFGYCTGTCGTLGPLIAAFNYDITALGASIRTQTVAEPAITLSGCSCHLYVLVQTDIPAGESWQLGYGGTKAANQSNITLPSSQLWLLTPASTVNAADKTLGPKGTKNANKLFSPGAACRVLAAPPPLTFTYPGRTITVSISLTVDPSCTATNLSYDLTISASGTARTLKARVTSTAAGWAVDWASYQ